MHWGLSQQTTDDGANQWNLAGALATWSIRYGGTSPATWNMICGNAERGSMNE